MENTKMYLNVNEVATCMQISVPMAYKIIRRLNTELTRWTIWWWPVVSAADSSKKRSTAAILLKEVHNHAGLKVLNRERNTALCAPTGKAARNLTNRTGLTARTVHSALGLHPHEDFLAPVRWETVDLVIVDEASMLTLEMMAGILHISKAHKTDAVFSVQLPDGRCPQWEGNRHLTNLTLAYALTIHKSQGSEYDTVLLPITWDMQRMLSRNLFYTAISRAKKQVMLFGDSSSVDVAMRRLLPPRKSNLVAKTRMYLFQCAG